jgi:tRNA dimethylallyltransferase
MNASPRRFILSDANQALEVFGPGDVLSIVGPTGSGKTSLALSLAKKLGPDKVLLVSVDSVAQYTELNIGSAKPVGAERSGARWAGLDLISVAETATSSRFIESVLPEITCALGENKKVILVGGSHFYEQALSMGRMPGEASDPEFQKSLGEHSNVNLHARLVAQDARFAQKINVADRYRITRYLDLCERQGLGFDVLSASQDLRPWKRVLTLSTFIDEDLDRRTASLKVRTDSMVKAGWVEEVEALINAGISHEAPGLQTIGYREVVLFVRGVISHAEMCERVLISHRQLAKVQRTWVRGLIKKSDTLD